MQKIYKIQELADIINIGSTYVYSLIKTNKLKVRKVKKGIYEVLEPFDHLIVKNKITRFNRGKDQSYSKAEVEILNKYYVEKGARFCQPLLNNRSLESIKNKAGKLKLRRRIVCSDGYKFCRKCSTIKPLENFFKDHHRKGGFTPTCKNCMKEYSSTPKNIKRKRSYDLNRVKNKLKNDPLFKLQRQIRKRLLSALKAQNAHKKSGTVDLLGCSIQYFKLYMENKFQPGMAWENHGIKGWHIDHIRPCASFDLTKEEEQRKCFHYTNLQPLWAFDNLSKKDKIIN